MMQSSLMNGAAIHNAAVKAPRAATGGGMNPSRARMRRHEAEAERRIAKALNKLRLDVARGMTPANVNIIPSRLAYRSVIQPFIDVVVDVLRDIALDGAEHGRFQVERFVFGIKTGIGIDWELANVDAERWARQYGYNLVGGISSTTRARLQREIAEWTRNDEGINQLAKRLSRPNGPFGEKRAKTIAVTETTRAFAAGNREAWRASDVVEGRRWNTAVDELVCPICGPLHNMVKPLDEDFPVSEGDPPAHPNCRCWTTPVVEGAEERETGLEQHGFVQEEKPKRPTFVIPQNAQTRGRAIRHTEGLMDESDIDNVMWVSEQMKEQCDVCVRVPRDTLEVILDDGKMKNQHETKSSRGTLDNQLREDAEYNMFGIKKGSDPGDYPIYGYLRTDGYVEPLLDQYGHVRITLKKEIKERTSFNYNDSLLGASRRQLVPAPLSEPHRGNIGFVSGYNVNRDVPLSENMSRLGVRYVEAQIHGGITIDDIERVEFMLRPSKEVREKLESVGLKAGYFDSALGY